MRIVCGSPRAPSPWTVSRHFIQTQEDAGCGLSSQAALGRSLCTLSSLANTNTSLPDAKLDTHKEIPPSPIYPQRHCRNVPLQIQIHKPKSSNNNILMPLVAYSQSMVMFSSKQAIKLVSSWLDTNFLSQRSRVLGIMLMKYKSNPSLSQEADAI